MESFKEGYIYYMKLQVHSIRAALTRWYDRAKRDLPWRRTRDPYAIWISEIMLQQTRVAAVIPYYQRFLSAFPDANALAQAPEERVLALWSGLGYYSRARNLQKAARQIVTFAKFPRDYHSIRDLAGVGEYTAASIASIAFGLPHAAIDGNVKRVMARLTNQDTGNVKEQAAILLDRSDPGRWNQAVMELGAMICLPRDPRCGECPIARYCQARRHGTQNSLPAKRVKPPAVHLTRTLLVIRGARGILLRPSPLVKGFWDLPERIDGVRASGVAGEFRHTITHRHYRFVVREATLARTGRVPKALQWFADGELNEIPLSTAAKKALLCLEK